MKKLIAAVLISIVFCSVSMATITDTGIGKRGGNLEAEHPARFDTAGVLHVDVNDACDVNFPHTIYSSDGIRDTTELYVPPLGDANGPMCRDTDGNWAPCTAADVAALIADANLTVHDMNVGGSLIVDGNTVDIPDMNGIEGLFTRDSDGNYHEATTADVTTLTGDSNALTADFTKTTDSNLQEITGLSVALVTGRTYKVDASIFVDSNSIADCNADFSGTATYSNSLWERRPYPSDSNSATITYDLVGTFDVNGSGTIYPRIAGPPTTTAALRGSTISTVRVK